MNEEPNKSDKKRRLIISEKQRTVVLLILLVIAVGFIVWTRSSYSTNFVEGF